MESLAKIHQVLTLKRSSLERDIAVLEAYIRSYETQIKHLENQKRDMVIAVMKSSDLEASVNDALVLQKWEGGVRVKIENLQQQIDEKIQELLVPQQALKEILVKQDVIKMQWDAARKTAHDAWQEAESETRLEGWVTANRI